MSQTIKISYETAANATDLLDISNAVALKGKTSTETFQNILEAITGYNVSVQHSESVAAFDVTFGERK